MDTITTIPNLVTVALTPNETRLIAAAPDLLEACEESLKRFEALCSCEVSSGCPDAKRRAELRAAIAKATGKGSVA